MSRAAGRGGLGGGEKLIRYPCLPRQISQQSRRVRTVEKRRLTTEMGVIDPALWHDAHTGSALTVMRRQATPLIMKDIPVTFTLSLCARP